MCSRTLLFFYCLALLCPAISFLSGYFSFRKITDSNVLLMVKKRRPQQSSGEVEELLSSLPSPIKNMTIPKGSEDGKLFIPEQMGQSGMIDEKTLRGTVFGKLLFPILERFFPIFREPNWYDLYGKLSKHLTREHHVCF